MKIDDTPYQGDVDPMEMKKVLEEYCLPDKYSLEELKNLCHFFNHELLHEKIGLERWAETGEYVKGEILSSFIRKVIMWDRPNGIKGFLNYAKEDESIKRMLTEDDFSLVAHLNAELPYSAKEEGVLPTFIYQALLDAGIPKFVAFSYLILISLSSRKSTSTWHENEVFVNIAKEGFADIFEDEKESAEDLFTKLGLYSRDLVAFAYECDIVFPKNAKLRPHNMGVRIPQNLSEMRAVLLTCWHNLPPEFIMAAAKIKMLANLIKESELATDRQREEANKTLSKVSKMDGLASTTYEKRIRCAYYTGRNIRCQNKTYTTYLDGWCGGCSGRPIPVRETMRGKSVHPFDMPALDEACESYIEKENPFSSEILQAFAEIAYEGNTIEEDSFTESDNKIAIKNITKQINEFSVLAKGCHNFNTSPGQTEKKKQMGVSYFENLPRFFQWNAVKNAHSIKISNKGAWVETFNHAIIDWSVKLENMGVKDIIVIPSSQQTLMEDGGVLKKITPSQENEFKECQPQEWEFSDEHGKVDKEKSEYISLCLSRKHTTLEAIEAMMHGEWPDNIRAYGIKPQNPMKEVRDSLPVDENGRVAYGKFMKGKSLTAFLPVKEICGIIKESKSKYEPIFLLRIKSNGDIEFIKTERNVEKAGSIEIIGGIGDEPPLMDEATRVGEFPSPHKEADLIRGRISHGVGTPEKDKKGHEGFDDLILLDAQKMLIGIKIATSNQENYVSIAASSSLCYIDCTPSREEGSIGVAFRTFNALTIPDRYADTVTIHTIPKECFALPRYLLD